MTDVLDQAAAAAGTDAEANPGGDNDAAIEAAVNQALEKALASTFDKRFSGLATLIDTKIKPLATELAQLKTAGLTPEEQEQLEASAAQQEIERLRAENQILSLRKNHPDAVDFFMEAMGQASLEDQIAFIESRLGKAAATAVQEAVEEAVAEGSPAVPVTDPNNPPRKQKPLGNETAVASGQMSDAIADALLANAPKGSLAALRKQGQA